MNREMSTHKTNLSRKPSGDVPQMSDDRVASACRGGLYRRTHIQVYNLGSNALNMIALTIINQEGMVCPICCQEYKHDWRDCFKDANFQPPEDPQCDFTINHTWLCQNCGKFYPDEIPEECVEQITRNPHGCLTCKQEHYLMSFEECQSKHLKCSTCGYQHHGQTCEQHQAEQRVVLAQYQKPVPGQRTRECTNCGKKHPGMLVKECKI